MGAPLVRVARAGEIPPGKSKKFFLDAAGQEVECFLVNWKGNHYGYVNRCRHIAMSLDWVENRFFNEDAEFLLCPTHGAHYQPDSGFCVYGPPAGKSLVRVPLVVENGEIFAGVPENFEDVL